MFTRSARLPLNNIKKDVAIDNARRMKLAVEHIMDRFETSPNFFNDSIFTNSWINHPDEYFVQCGIFKNLFRNFFGDIHLQDFLTDYKFDDTAVGRVKDFCNSCDWLYSKLSFIEVECAYDQLLNMHARLLKM